MSREQSPQLVFDHDDDSDMLESLKGLSIKGFQDGAEPSHMNTPSSTNASLPTPQALKSSIVFFVTPAQSDDGNGWYPPDQSIAPPGAPLIKDLDSFTEGTGQGSFDFLAPAGADERFLFYHPTDHATVDDCSSHHLTTSNSLSLEHLPSPGRLEEVVQAWRENVEIPPPADVPKKRRRSFTLDGESDERRTRQWSPTTESSHIAYLPLSEADLLARRTDPAPPD